MSLKTVFELKKLSGWDAVDVKDILIGQTFRVLVDGVPVINENGTEEFHAYTDAFQDDEGTWRVAI